MFQKPRSPLRILGPKMVMRKNFILQIHNYYYYYYYYFY